MWRREFIGFLGGIAAWPFAAHAQQAMPVIGFISGQSAESFSYLAAAFRRGLREAGFVNGQNARVEYRWGDGRNERLPALVDDLLAHGLTALVSSGGIGVARVAHQAAVAKAVPLVFATGSDPVQYGLVASLNRPGGNATGVTFLVNQLSSKRLGLATQLIPASRAIGFMVRLSNATSTRDIIEVETAAAELGVKLVTFKVERMQDFEAAFVRAAADKLGIVLVASDPFFNSHRKIIVTLAAKHAVPAMYEIREFVNEGGLISYGTSIVEGYRQLGIYTGRIVKGEKPADLPVLQSDRFELAINMKTAQSLGIVIPQNLLVAADEVIE